MVNDLIPGMIDENLALVGNCGVEENTDGTEPEHCNPNDGNLAPEGAIPLTEDDVREIASNVLTEEYIQGTVETAIDEMDAFLQNETDEPEIVIDLSEYRSTLIDEFIGVLEDEYNALPICTAAQQSAQAKAEGQEFPECRPEGVDFDEFSDLSTDGQDLEEMLTEGMGESIPEKIDILKPTEWQIGDSETPQNIDELQQTQDSIHNTMLQVRDWYNKITLWIYIAIGVDAVFILLILVIYLGNMRAGFRWAGIPLIVSGGIVFIAALASGAVFNRTVVPLLETSQEGMPEYLSTELTSLATSIVRSINSTVMLYSGIVLGVGVLLVGLSFVFKKKERNQPAGATPASPPASPPVVHGPARGPSAPQPKV